MPGRRFNIAVLPGDGIGPEVTAEALKVLKAVGSRFGVEFHFQEALIGGCAVDLCGNPFPPETERIADHADAIFMGAVGGQKWDGLPSNMRPEAGLLAIRKRFDLFANLRPVKLLSPLSGASPLREDIRKRGFDILIVRELTSGLYYGKPKEQGSDGQGQWAVDTMYYHEKEVERVARVAFSLAMGRNRKVTSVDKANVLESSKLWRKVVTRVAADYPEVSLDHMYVDNCAMQMVKNPSAFDVLVTENTFGDILSDLGGALAGSLGLLPSASLNQSMKGLYEPVHGSAPDIAGQGIANPLAAILTAAMMVRYSFNMPEAADIIESAVDAALSEGYRTPDIMEQGMKLVTTREMGDIVLDKISHF